MICFFIKPFISFSFNQPFQCVHQYRVPCFYKSVLNWTFCQLLVKSQLHEALTCKHKQYVFLTEHWHRFCPIKGFKFVLHRTRLCDTFPDWAKVFLSFFEAIKRHSCLARPSNLLFLNKGSLNTFEQLMLAWPFNTVGGIKNR